MCDAIPRLLGQGERETFIRDSCLSAIGKTAASKHTNYIMTVRTLARKLGHYSFHYYKTTSPLLPAAAPACCHPHSIIIFRVAGKKKKSPQIQSRIHKEGLTESAIILCKLNKSLLESSKSVVIHRQKSLYSSKNLCI